MSNHAHPLPLQPLSVTRLLAEVINDHRELAADRNQRIALECPDRDAPIMGDKDRLIQILVNLTQNAREAAPDGAQITWRVSDDPGQGTVALEVKNLGEPIRPEILTQLTEPFFSAKPSGTGLGLAIVRRLTLVHGEELSFSSTETDGTTLHLVFPRLDANADSNDSFFTAPTNDPWRTPRRANIVARRGAPERRHGIKRN